MFGRLSGPSLVTALGLILSAASLIVLFGTSGEADSATTPTAQKTPGAYRYIHRIHQLMKGSIVVR